ncbi:MAG: hypothetical protein HY775_06445 [Acidobacteria bacterium]|nr:hypothetical protein [Acidobacteriota bacterium]
MLTRDPALRFWLHYAEREGALLEETADRVLVLLPDRVREVAGLPEEVALTADPEVAREEGAVLLLPGHPALAGVAERVLEEGDAGLVWLAWPPARPSADALLARARELLPVDHGRIDLEGEPAPAYTPLLRVGVLVTYMLSLDDRFTEREEIWVDARSGLGLEEGVGRRLAGCLHLDAPESARDVLRGDFARALREAHAALDRRAGERLEILARQTEGALADELARADAYYDAVLAALALRHSKAPPERRALLDARGDATRAERARRAEEIREKYRPRREIRPFRLHSVLAPALALPTVVRRGERCFPRPLVWLPAVSAFVPTPCPCCGARDGLVAGRDRLGCRECLPSPAAPERPTPERPTTDRPTPERPTPERPTPEGPTPERPTPDPPAASPVRGHKVAACSTRPAPSARESRAPAVPGHPARRECVKAGNKMALDLWRAVAGLGEWRPKATGPGSPAEAAFRLWGIEGPAFAVGIPPGVAPFEAVAATDEWGGTALAETTQGAVRAGRERYPFTLRWRAGGRVPILLEVLPFPVAPGTRFPPRFLLAPHVVRSLYERVPAPYASLDPVARMLWEVHLPAVGLSLTLRCLAAWWRLPGPARPAGPPEVLAAGLARLVGAAAGVRSAGAVPGIAPADVRSAAGELGEMLRISRQQPW